MKRQTLADLIHPDNNTLEIEQNDKLTGYPYAVRRDGRSFFVSPAVHSLLKGAENMEEFMKICSRVEIFDHDKEVKSGSNVQRV